MQTKVKQNLDPEPLSKVSKRGIIGKILSKVGTLQKLNHTLYQIVPDQLKAHCQIVNLNGFQIILGANSSAVANSLYYKQNEILTALQRQHPECQINSIRVKVSAV